MAQPVCVSVCPYVRVSVCPRVRLHVSGSVCPRVRVSKVVEATRERKYKDGMGMPIPYGEGRRRNKESGRSRRMSELMQ
jgi:hypothetical protein